MTWLYTLLTLAALGALAEATEIALAFLLAWLWK
jgi:hypothetical protein